MTKIYTTIKKIMPIVSGLIGATINVSITVDTNYLLAYIILLNHMPFKENIILFTDCKVQRGCKNSKS